MNARDSILLIKYQLDLGAITYDEAKVLAKPFIEEMNEKAKAIAKEYHRKTPTFNFISLMR